MPVKLNLCWRITNVPCLLVAVRHTYASGVKQAGWKWVVSGSFRSEYTKGMTKPQKSCPKPFFAFHYWTQLVQLYLLCPSVIPGRISWSSAISTSSWKPEFPRHTQIEKCGSNINTSFPKVHAKLSTEQTAAEVKIRLMHSLFINRLQNSSVFLRG